MMTAWTEMGFIRFPLALIAIAMLVQTVRAVLDLRRGGDAGDDTRSNTLLVWGLLAVAMGVLGTLVGIAQMAGVLASVEAESTLVWSGLRVTLSSTVAGLLLFGYASLAWVVLQGWHRREAAAV